MPLLAVFIGGLIQSLASFLATWVTKKTALGLASVSVFAALTVAAVAVFSAGVSAAKATIPAILPDAFVFGFSYFTPDNLPTCMGIIFAAHVAAAAYRWNVTNLKLVALVS